MWRDSGRFYPSAGFTTATLEFVLVRRMRFTITSSCATEGRLDTGKSRTVQGVAVEVFTLPFNLRFSSEKSEFDQ